MSTLLDPLIIDSLKYAGRGVETTGLNFFPNFSLSGFVINFILPLLFVLFTVLYLKLKWDKKHGKLSYEMTLK